MSKEALIYLCHLVLKAGRRPGRVAHRAVATRAGISHRKVGRLVDELEAHGLANQAATGQLDVLPDGVEEARVRFDAGEVTAADLGIEDPDSESQLSGIDTNDSADETR